MPQPGSSEWNRWKSLSFLTHLGHETDVTDLKSSQTPAAGGGAGGGTPNPNPTPAPAPGSGSGSSTGGIVGGVFAGVIVGAAALLFVRKRRADRSCSSLPVDADAAAKMQGSTPIEHTNTSPVGIELDHVELKHTSSNPVTADASAAGNATPCSSCGAPMTGTKFCPECGAKA